MVKETYFEANTYGIGQLITQRKMFVVPQNQRDFAWTTSDVEMFFDDIVNAMDRNDPDYFIGLVVLLGPADNKWTILDGQQRLVTTTMMYSAIRSWLWDRGFEQDANQIESEFIAVRMLGGDYLPRFSPNVTNRQMFVETVVDKCPETDIRQKLEKTSRYSSNRLLLEANLLCRQKANDFVCKEGDKIYDQANRLFRLASYLETRVRVVAMDVSSEANAYTIFESLNARGNELAVVDLVKNYVFGRTDPAKLRAVQDQWQSMADALEDKKIDDFLKTFWTSQFGRVQKPQLYSQIKESYSAPESAERLVSELLVKSEHYLALEDPGHDIWKEYGERSQTYLRSLITLGSRQVRAPIMSAMTYFGREQMEALLWGLLVLTIRHQTVGRRRTGLLEMYCAGLANQIYSRKMEKIESILDSIYSFAPKDEEFRIDFERFADSKKDREIYFLTELENTKRRKDGSLSRIETNTVGYDIVHLLGRVDISKFLGDGDSDSVDEYLEKIGNKVLLEKTLNSKDNKRQFKSSSLLLTREIDVDLTLESIDRRQRYLAELAMETWTISRIR